MTTLRGWTATLPLPILALALGLASLACNPSASASASLKIADSPSSPALTAVPGGPGSPVVGASIGPPTTTTTEFGAIFDALPSTFPKLPGQTPAETDRGPTSGSFAVNMDAASASKAIAAGLVAQGWSVDVGSALEDGTLVLEATGPDVGCKAEVRFTPASGTMLMSVLYGAACPFS